MLTLAIACLSLAARPIKNPVSPPGYSTKRGSLPTLIAQRVELATSSNKIANQCARPAGAHARRRAHARARPAAIRFRLNRTSFTRPHVPARATTVRSLPLDIPPAALGPSVDGITALGIRSYRRGKEVEILWQTMKKCYPNEKAALEAVSKNAAVVQPQARSPIPNTFHYQSGHFQCGSVRVDP